MHWIDLHCDTAMVLHYKKASLLANDFHIDLEKSHGFERFLQCAALFCPPKIGDNEGFDYICDMARYFLSEIEKNSDSAALVKTKAELESVKTNGKRGFMLTVEDARILAGDASRLDILYDLGVRIVTPLWWDKTCIGGSHTTKEGLSDFGKCAVAHMLELGILPDVSHASRASFDDIVALARAAKKPVIATHSCTAALCGHTRNLTDVQIRIIAGMGGVIGVNFYPGFLSDTGKATMEDVFSHMRHMVNVGGIDAVAVGTDFDGVETLPEGVNSLSDLADMPEQMKKYGFTEHEIESICFKNAQRIIYSTLK